MDEDIVAIISMTITIISITLGFPLVRAYVKRKEQAPPRELVNVDAKLEAMNSALDSMAVEIERISENQRFLTKLLADRDKAKAALPSEKH